jgi:integrase
MCLGARLAPRANAGRRACPTLTAMVASIHTQHESHKAWPAELCEKFEALPHPRLVLAYDLMRYTGQRRSDIVQMTWKRFDGKAIELIQEKTGTYVWLPCHPTLAKKLARVERTAPTFSPPSAADHSRLVRLLR